MNSEPDLTGSSTPLASPYSNRLSSHVRHSSNPAPPPLVQSPSARSQRIFSLSSTGTPTFQPVTFNFTSPEIPLPNPDELLKQVHGVVKSRSGSVLSRGLILKGDLVLRPQSHSLTTLEGIDGGGIGSGGFGGLGALDPSNSLSIKGAANFRQAELGVFGLAQPTITGVRSVLALLRSQPVLGPGGTKGKGRETVWFSTREEAGIFIGESLYVLRDASAPTRTRALTDRAQNLEEIEDRLKQDVIKEANRYGGLILVQEEIGDQDIVNTWVAADQVRTIREVFDDVRIQGGYNVVYHRVPVTRDQSPDDRYLDTYATLLSQIPPSSSLVFNCGVGVVRTTFAMCAALIVRRRQMIDAGTEDPYERVLVEGAGGRRKQHDLQAESLLRARSEQATRDQSLLRLMNLLQKSLATRGHHTVLSFLSSQPQLLESLRTALLGNYDIILSLLSTLDGGTEQKRLVDAIVDNCDALVNIRESVLEHRVRYASSALLDEDASKDSRAKALAALERYFFLISFSSYVQETGLQSHFRFSEWLHSRPEIYKMLGRMRKTGHFYVFSPVHDLSAIARGDAGELSAFSDSAKGRFVDVQRSGGEVIGDEWASQIVRSRGGIVLRAGLLLKSDQWRVAAEGHESAVEGAQNFRRVPHSSLYGLSQPTQDGIDRVLKMVSGTMPSESRVCWINLREEPLLYINGTPYVLRQEAVSLRNVKSYAGISSSRLELLEERLKSDVLAELKTYGRLLLHSETADGFVTPAWEVIESASNIQTLREVMDAAGAKLTGYQFEYRRIPITAERSPDFNDVKDIVELVAQLDAEKSAVIVNCQQGRGRSTRAQVLITLVQRWLRGASLHFPASGPEIPRSTRFSYTVINNLLRVTRYGREVKNAVDDAITICNETFDLLDAIEDSRQAAEDAQTVGDGARLKERTQRGILNLRSYFFLILFSSFLSESKAQTWRELQETSYESYVRGRPVFKTIERELDSAGLEALVPLEKPLASGNANIDEVRDFVAKRSGRILSAWTLLKSDFFSGLQKMSLPERVEGAPNFRQVRLLFQADGSPSPYGLDRDKLWGVGMPTISGLRRALERMGAKERNIVWTCMREEPVVYVSAGRPHVLRLFEAPLENVVTTGVTADIVEGMERALKNDLLKERAANDGKVLLHDETEEADGSFTVTASWEELDVHDLLTPSEVFQLMRDEGFNVDYERLPVTDEQAPLPAIYSRIEERVVASLKESKETGSEVGFVFQCQMGRGRTTTGMVAAALISNILLNPSIFDLSASVVHVDHDEPAGGWDGREAEPFLKGEYQLILQLVTVMQHGKLAKKLADKAIDTMEGVQNLRRAVYDFKLRCEAATGKKQHKLLEQALGYMRRYATILIFAEYLLEKAAAAYAHEDDEGEERDPETILPPFKTWFSEHRELKQLLSRQTLD